MRDGRRRVYEALCRSDGRYLETTERASSEQRGRQKASGLSVDLGLDSAGRFRSEAIQVSIRHPAAPHCHPIRRGRCCLGEVGRQGGLRDGREGSGRRHRDGDPAATALLVKVHTPVAEGARVAGSLDRGSVRAHDSGTAGAQQAYLLADAG